MNGITGLKYLTLSLSCNEIKIVILYFQAKNISEILTISYWISYFSRRNPNPSRVISARTPCL